MRNPFENNSKPEFSPRPAYSRMCQQENFLYYYPATTTREVFCVNDESTLAIRSSTEGIGGELTFPYCVVEGIMMFLEGFNQEEAYFFLHELVEHQEIESYDIKEGIYEISVNNEKIQMPKTTYQLQLSKNIQVALEVIHAEKGFTFLKFQSGKTNLVSDEHPFYQEYVQNFENMYNNVQFLCSRAVSIKSDKT